MAVEALREIACSMYPVDAPDFCCDSLPFGLRALAIAPAKRLLPISGFTWPARPSLHSGRRLLLGSLSR